MSLVLDTNSPPKLTTLPKLPCKPKESTQALTPPPLQPLISIPFQWEESPGKPRAAPAPPYEAAVCLNLPPRLMLMNDDSGITITPSLMTSKDGPYVGRSLSLMCTFSFRKGPLAGRGGARKLGSGRRGSFSEGKFVDRGSFDFSSGDGSQSEKNVRIPRVGRKRSFFTLSSMDSNMLADIYDSFKQAVPWRRRP